MGAADATGRRTAGVDVGIGEDTDTGETCSGTVLMIDHNASVRRGGVSRRRHRDDVSVIVVEKGVPRLTVRVKKQPVVVPMDRRRVAVRRSHCTVTVSRVIVDAVVVRVPACPSTAK